MGLNEIRNLKQAALLPKPKKQYVIPRKSKKKIEQEKLLGSGDGALDAWFVNRRKELTGTCQCGCAQKSQKDDDAFYRHSICHIFPKSKFESVATHPLNYVERAFWGGCHGVLDDTSMDRWPGMGDWDDIKEKFFILSPFLTAKERATKFYSKLEELVNNN